MERRPRDFGSPAVEGIKGCQMAGPSVGRAWQREKGESLETSCAGSFVCYLSAMYVLLSVIDAKRQFLCPSGAQQRVKNEAWILREGQ